MNDKSARFAILLALAGSAVGSAQTTQEWTAPLDGNQPGSLQWTTPGPLAVDAAGRVLATATTREPLPPPSGGSQIVSELVQLLDASGQTLWSQSQATFHITADVVASPTGGFLLLSTDGVANGLKLTWRHADGIQQWVQTVPNSGGPQPHGLAVDAQGTAYFCGYDFLGGLVVAAVDVSGALLWTRNIAFGAGLSGEPAGLALGGSGAVYVRADVSETVAPYTRTLRVTKLTTSGVVQWTRTAPGATTIGSTARSYRALCADANGVVVGGEVELAAQVYEGYVVRYDSAGTLQWSQTIAGTHPVSCVVDRIAFAPDGTAWTMSFSSAVNTPPPYPYPSDLAVSRLDTQGALLSSTIYSAPGATFTDGVELLVGSAGQAWIAVVAFELPQPNVMLIHPRLALFDAAGALVADDLLDPTGAVPDETLFAARAAPDHRIVLTGGEGQSPGDVAFAVQLDVADAPQGYCTPKVNSLGCTPRMTFTGLPSASATGGFALHVSNVRDHKPGLFLYSVAGAAAVPFQGGTLCLQAPIRRTPQVNSDGTTGCTGTYSLDFNAFAHGGLGGAPDAALLVAGTAVHCQAWGRDQGFPAPNNTALSSALRYVVFP